VWGCFVNRTSEATWLSNGGDASSIRIALGGAIGHFVEWYDWAIYGSMAGVFSRQIFPADDPLTSLLLTFLVFALGFGARPLGAIVLAPLADQIGRRTVLTLSIGLMGLGAFVIGVTPTYGAIGVLAPAIFILARLLQGFSAGGEFQSALIFLAEHAPRGRRALAGSAAMVGLGLSILAASATGTLIIRLIPEPSLSAWGWRAPFLCGAVVSLWAVWLRMRLPETPAFAHAQRVGSLPSKPFRRALKHHRRELLYVALFGLTNIHFYIWVFYLPVYANRVSGLPLWQGLMAETISVAVFTVVAPLSGVLADHIGRKPLMLTWAFGFAVLTWPMFLLVRDGGIYTYLIASVIGMVLIALIFGAIPAAMSELFPTGVRASGTGIAYAISTAIFGGTAPLIASWVTAHGGDNGIVWYVIAASLICGAGFMTMTEARGRDLTRD
jgi:MFS family permease